MASDFAQQVKEQTDIVRIVGEYVRLKKAGAQNWSGLCPFHKEKSPSFSVHQTRQFFHCFGCGKSGDVFTFVKEIENVSFPEAVRAVAQKAGIPLPKQQFSSPHEAEEARQRGVMLDIHEKAAEFFTTQLQAPEGAKAREYLHQQRALDDKVIHYFRIGYAPDDFSLLKDALKRHFSEDQLKAAGMLKESQNAGSTYSAFRNRVMFPICNEAGRVIAFTGRTLANNEKAGPKYLNSPETPIYTKGRVLFNLDKAKEAIRKLDYAIVVEGNVDCITVFASGFQNVIATSGTAFTETQVRLLGRFTKNIVVNFDPDNAGANATEKSLGLLLEEDFNVRVLTLEPGFDPDLFIRRKGKQAYTEALTKSLSYPDYLIERARTLFPPRSSDAKVKAVNWLLPHIQRIPNRIKRDELAMDAAQKLGIDSNTLRQELKQAAITRTTRQIRLDTTGAVTDAEKVLLRALAPGAPREFQETQTHLREAIQHESLHEGLASESLLSVMLAHPEAGNISDLPLDDTSRRTLASVLMDEISGEQDFEVEMLQHALSALRRIHLERQQRKLAADLAAAERQNDAMTIARLLQQKVELARALREL